MMEKPLASSRWPLIGTFSRRQYSLLRAARAECCRSHVVRKDIGCSDRRFDGAPAPLRISPLPCQKGAKATASRWLYESETLSESWLAVRAGAGLRISGTTCLGS